MRSKGRAGTTRSAKRTLVLLQVVQLIVISMEYFVAMFAMFQGYIGQEIAVIPARQGRRPPTNNHFSGFQSEQGVTFKDNLSRLVSQLDNAKI